jgi:RNA polymerase sigma-70 factor, ECF subfamily
MTSTAQFDEVYDRYKDVVYRLAFHLTQDRAEAEDMFQEVWLRVVRRLPENARRENLKPWLAVIVMNLHRDMLRKKRIRRMFFLGKTKTEMTEVAAGGKTAASSYDPAGRAEEAVTRKDIDRALARLPEKQRRVFVLKEIEGLEQTEIAAALRIPVGTVKSLMYRAVRRLQRELASYHPKGEKIKCDARILSV